MIKHSSGQEEWNINYRISVQENVKVPCVNNPVQRIHFFL